MQIASTVYIPLPYRQDGVRDAAHALKAQDAWALQFAARHLAVGLSAGDVLIPVPGHLGDTAVNVALAQAVASLCGAQIADILRGTARASQYTARASALQPPTVIGTIPHGRLWLLDNVAVTGTTLAAAKVALPEAICRAFAEVRLF